MCNYYTLLVKYDEDDTPYPRWSVAFGDYDPEVVREERLEYRRDDYVLRTKIICTDESQEAVDREVRLLNNPLNLGNI